MAYARLVTEGDGSTTQFAVNFALDYLLEADVTCRVGTEADGLGDPVYRTLTWNNPNLVTIGGAVVADGVQIVFQRRVDRESLRVMFEDGDVLNETNLDNMQKQLIMLVHEVLDDSASFGSDIAALELAVAGLITTVNASLAAALDTAQDIADAAAASASAASGSASSASASAVSAATVYDNFDDRYLGAKAADPTLDNDGGALLTGALYFNTVSAQMRVWSGSAWIVAYNPALGAVDSVFGRTGAVTANAGDYTAAKITNTPAGNIAATTVQAALNELDSEKAALSHTHSASQISDSTTVGRALLTAVDAAAQRTALSLTVGTNVQAYDANTAKINVAQSWSAKQTFTTTQKFQQVLEKVIISGSAPAATENFDVLTQAVSLYNGNNANNWTLNVRGNSGTTLDATMATGEAMSIAVVVTNSGTAYRMTAITIDGAANTPTWLGAAAPAAGTINKKDTYTFTIIKTGSATFTVLASFAAGN